MGTASKYAPHMVSSAQMGRLRWLILAAYFTCSLVHAQPGIDCPRDFTLAFHDHGLLYSADRDEGIDKDIANELKRRSGCKFRYSLMPRARIWQLIEAGALDFSLSGITNAERDKFAEFAWYFTDKFQLLVRKDAKVESITEFSHRKELRLGVIRSFRYGNQGNALVDQLGEQDRVSYATALEPLYELLIRNSVQAMIIEPFDYPDIQSSRIKAVSTVIDFNDPSVPHGLIMSRRSLSLEQRGQWKQIVEAMRADGTLLRIFLKYFSPEQARAMLEF